LFEGRVSAGRGVGLLLWSARHVGEVLLVRLAELHVQAETIGVAKISKRNPRKIKGGSPDFQPAPKDTPLNPVTSLAVWYPASCWRPPPA